MQLVVSDPLSITLLASNNQRLRLCCMQAVLHAQLQAGHACSCNNAGVGCATYHGHAPRWMSAHERSPVARA